MQPRGRGQSEKPSSLPCHAQVCLRSSHFVSASLSRDFGKKKNFPLLFADFTFKNTVELAMSTSRAGETLAPLPQGVDEDEEEELDRDRKEDRDDRVAERDRDRRRRAWCRWRRLLDLEPVPRRACARVRCRLRKRVPASGASSTTSPGESTSHRRHRISRSRSGHRRPNPGESTSGLSSHRRHRISRSRSAHAHEEKYGWLARLRPRKNTDGLRDYAAPTQAGARAVGRATGGTASRGRGPAIAAPRAVAITVTTAAIGTAGITIATEGDCDASPRDMATTIGHGPLPPIPDRIMTRIGRGKYRSKLTVAGQSRHRYRPQQLDFLRCCLQCVTHVTHGKRLSHLYHVLHMVNV